jgi:hypothetical protein
MDLNLPGLTATCFVTGNAFVEDDRVVSHLVRVEGETAVMRYDVHAASTGSFETPGRVVCRWTQGFKPKAIHENAERDLKLTAETLFLTLADPLNELSDEDARLVQFLALMMERKRVIKPKGRSADGVKTIYEHRGTKARYEVPMGNLDPAFFIAVQEQLSVLVGAPDEAGAEGGVRPTESAGASGPGQPE